MSEDRGREETRDEDCKRPVQISVEEERSRELEQQTRSFLSVMQALITTSPRPGCSGAGAGLRSSGNMEPSGFSSRGGSRDGLFSSRNFPISISVGPGVASTSTMVRMPTSNPQSVQSTMDLPGSEEGSSVLGGEVSEEKPPASAVSTTTQQALEGEVSGGHDHEALTSDAEDEDAVEKAMTEQHRELLTLSREELVRDMTPDEIFNILIAEKIFTTSDVSRIKGSNNIREEVNEELLNYLARRPDRAFCVFKEALEKTLQSHLSDLLDPSKNSRFKKAQKRKQSRLAAQSNSPGAKAKRLLSLTIPSSTSTSTSTIPSTAPVVTTAFSFTQETDPPEEQALEAEAISIPARSFTSHASPVAEASDGPNVGSSAGFNRQESMACRASLVELLGSQGFHKYKEQFSSHLGSHPCQSVGQHHPGEVFHGSSYLDVDAVDSMNAEREQGSYGEVDSETGTGSQGMEEVFEAYLELENRFMEMARNAYAQLAPRDGSDEALQQFMVEYVKTNQHLQTTVQLLSRLKEVCRWHPNHNT